MRFKKFLIEHYLNLFKEEDKKLYADDIWNMLQNAYRYIGGLKGSGFSSKDEMIKKIHMWKLNRRDGKINAFILYKDSNGRKLVAIGTDGTEQGKEDFKKMFKEELVQNRAYGEISHSVLKLAFKILGDELFQHLVPSDEVSKILGKEISKTDAFKYKRNIGGDEIEKIMYGVPFLKIVRN